MVASPARDGAVTSTMVESREAMVELQFPGHVAATSASMHGGGASLVMCECAVAWLCACVALLGHVIADSILD